MALTAERDTVRRAGTDRGAPVAAATTIYAGSLVCLNAAGNAVPGAVSATLRPIGRALETVVNTGSAGDETVRVEAGVFRWDNDGADPVTRAHIGADCYVLDDETVSSSHDTNARSVAGIVFDVDADGVWVRTGQKS